MRRLAAVVALFAALPAYAGLYLSSETVADLPAQWRGFLIDHRQLRQIAGGGPLRDEYAGLLAEIESRPAPLPADAEADRGALLVRLGKPDKAVEALRAAVARFPDDYRLHANLGTAWQSVGELPQAAVSLTHAARLAPDALKKSEGLHLRLVRLRQADAGGLDDLFALGHAPTPADKPRLPPDAVSRLQRLALSLPADGRLLHLLGELAFAHGDPRTAAAILDGCVTEFAMSDAATRDRRRVLRELADAAGDSKSSHEVHAASELQFRSPRPLVPRRALDRLPPVKPTGVNPLPWFVLAETRLDRRGKPTFAQHLDALDGRRVRLTGFMQPAGDGLELTGFLLVEYPVGCWFCETPDPAGLVYVALPDGKATTLKRGLVRVDGTLKLNRADSEQPLYAVEDAGVGEAD